MGPGLWSRSMASPAVLCLRPMALCWCWWCEVVHAAAVQLPAVGRVLRRKGGQPGGPETEGGELVCIREACSGASQVPAQRYGGPLRSPPGPPA